MSASKTFSADSCRFIQGHLIKILKSLKMKVEKCVSGIIHNKACLSDSFVFNYIKRPADNRDVKFVNILRALSIEKRATESYEVAPKIKKCAKNFVESKRLEDLNLFKLYNEVYSCSDKDNLVHTYEQRMYTMFRNFLPFAPKMFLSLLEIYPHSQEFLIAFIALHLPDFLPQDILELTVLQRAHIYSLYFRFSLELDRRSNPYYARAVNIIQTDLLQSPDYDKKIILNGCFASPDFNYKIQHIYEAIKWLVWLQKLSPPWCDTWKHLIQKLNVICLDYIGTHIHTCYLKDLLFLFDSSEHCLSFFKSYEFPFEHEELFLDFVYRAILNNVLDILRGKDYYSEICVSLLECVKWTKLRLSAIKLFQCRLKELSTEVAQIVHTSQAAACCLEFINNLRTCMRQYDGGTSEEECCSTNSPYKFLPSASWDVVDVQMAFCSSKSPPVLNLTKSSKVQISNVNVCGNQDTAIYSGDCKSFDVDYQVRKTRRTDAHPYIGFVTKNCLNEFPSSVTNLSWAVQIGSNKIITSYSTRLMPEKVQAPFRLVIDRKKNNIYVYHNCGVFVDKIPEIDGALYPVVSFSGGSLTAYFDSFHPELPPNIKTLLSHKNFSTFNLVHNAQNFCQNSQIDNLLFYKKLSYASPSLNFLLSSLKSSQISQLPTGKTCRRSEAKSVLHQAIINKIGFHSAIKYICRPIKLPPGAPKRYSLTRKFHSLSHYAVDL